MTSPIPSTLSTALAGIQNGLRNAANDAYKLSSSFVSQNAESNDTVDAVVGLAQDELQVQASAKVVGVERRLTGTILDIVA